MPDFVARSLSKPERVCILFNMVGGEINPHPIRLLFNYWELRPSCIGGKLDELAAAGVNELTSFVPWQAVESDISHSLMRFIQAATERKICVHLILSPEVGIAFPHSGVAKDLISKPENTALDCDSKPITVTLPPNFMRVPSLHSSDVTKRLNAYLSRMDAFFAELGRAQPQSVHYLKLVLTGSFWKYYRSSARCGASFVAGAGGDFSNPASVAYRQCVEQFYSHREFSDPTPLAANRWKTRAMEAINRKWFSQQSEEVFRARTFQMLRRKSAGLDVSEIELFTPESDPSFAYSRLLQVGCGGHADFGRLSRGVDEMCARMNTGSEKVAPPFVHWSALGGYASLSDSERQFLLLKSLLLLGASGGGVLLSEEEWFEFSQSFRTRAEVFARAIQHGDLRLGTRVAYLAPHLWSECGPLWDEIYLRVGPGARISASISAVSSDPDCPLVIVDPEVVLTRERVLRLTGAARAGKIVVLPRSPYYTEAARQELEQIAAQTRKIEINLGLTYRLHPWGDGKIVIYDLPERDAMTAQASNAWQTFATAMLSVAEVQNACRLSDSRLSIVPLETRTDGVALFVLNASHRPVGADILFQEKVAVSDLALKLAAQWAENGMMRGSLKEEAPADPAVRFALEVPACGILPLSVEGLSRSVASERLSAARASEQTRAAVAHAAEAELPGLNETDVEGPWN